MIDQDSQIKTFQKHTNVSRETIERLKEYHNLLKKWNTVINLVGRNTIDDIWTRHFLDSAQLWGLRPEETTTWLDLGSGAGFPGLVVAVLAIEDNPKLTVELVESDERKSAFLITASQILGVNTKVHTHRIENMHHHGPDVISARALASLTALFEYSEPLMTTSTELLFQKGKNCDLELTDARKNWIFELQKSTSVTNSDGVILKIKGLGRV
jgi:16S rRNA (guanine527-N7)-methyltransferase